MKFIDEAVITIESGKGGRGCVSFRREKFVAKGGPNGGDGGDGGDVILMTTRRKRTLQQYRRQKYQRAGNGMPGEGNQRHGKGGADLILELPPGTVVTNAETSEVLKDFTKVGESFVIAQGGQGGRGNKRFTSATNRAPRFAQPGEPGQTMELKLDLKLLAEVGLVGLPNAGKSTLISVISSARPKIGNYPFTTITPNIGMVQPDWGEPFAVADIPGLVEGAHSGIGLGVKFLRHIERTSIILHLIDVSEINSDDPLKSYNTINKELSLYSRKLSEKPQIVVLNKIDIPDTQDSVQLFIKAFSETYTNSSSEQPQVVMISAVTQEGVKGLKKILADIVNEFRENIS